MTRRLEEKVDLANEGRLSLKSGRAPVEPRYPAKRNRFLIWLFKFYAQAFIRKQFCSMRVKNGKALAFRDPSRPTLCISNHCNWWDGLSDFLLVSQLTPESRFHAMVEELYRFPPLTYLGGFSVEKETARTATRALEYSVNLLKSDPRNLLWIYPQGKVCPQDTPSMEFANGVAYLLKKLPEINLIPVAQYYTFLTEDRPAILMEVGEPIQLTAATAQNREEVTTLLESSVENLLTDIRTNLAQGTLDEFTPMVKGEINPFKQVELSFQYSWEVISSIYRPIEALFRPTLQEDPPKKGRSILH